LNELTKMEVAANSLLDKALDETNTHEDRDDDEYDSGEEVADVLPGVLNSGVEYFPRRIVAEGWVHKKGTGRDWLGSVAWKPRWARLVVRGDLRQHEKCGV